MVPQRGFEPLTCGLGNRRSILLSYRGTTSLLDRPSRIPFYVRGKVGAGTVRTHAPRADGMNSLLVGRVMPVAFTTLHRVVRWTRVRLAAVIADEHDVLVVRRGGVEPPTTRLSSGCSTIELPALWSLRRVSNPRPDVYKTSALPTELRRPGDDNRWWKG